MDRGGDPGDRETDPRKRLVIVMLLLFLLIRGIIRATSPIRIRKTRKTTTISRPAPGPAPRPSTATRSAADRRRAESTAFRRDQAARDRVHLDQVRRDLLRAYEASGAETGETEKQIRKRIQYDEAIRRVDRRIEKAKYDEQRIG